MLPESDNITIVALPQDDAWFRDTGPIVGLQVAPELRICTEPVLYNVC
jgi:agmatine/peptidylarginine deiminase